MTQRHDYGGQVFWLHGLPGAGKTTLAQAFQTRLEAAGQAAVVLDGDQVRRGVNADLDYSDDSRLEHTRRVAEIAALIVSPRVTVVTALISPRERLRRTAREIIATRRPAVTFSGVFVDASLATCVARDVKGLYAQALRGERPDFTGVSAPFETPTQPELRLDSQGTSVEACVDLLFAEWERRARRS